MADPNDIPFAGSSSTSSSSSLSCKLRILFKASREGDLETLHKLLAEDSLVLEKVAMCSCSETPLHIAAFAKHADYAEEIIQRMPEFAIVLNKDGFSPIHIASANGCIKIVKDLLMIQAVGNLCLLTDAEGRTPLHFAVIQERIDVIKELISTSWECVRDVTVRRETVLHLAVRNNKVEALKVLVESNHIDDELLNAKDCDGNTLLHLAIFQRQYKTIEYLLLGQATASRIEVNAKNSINLTAIDVFDLFLRSSSCELQDIEMRETLRSAGAQSSQDISTTQQGGGPAATSVASLQLVSPTVQQNHISSPITSRRQQTTFYRVTNLLNDFSDQIFAEIEKTTSETRNALMVVAVLIATVTYQGGINPPGGVWQDHSHTNSNTITTDGVENLIHHAGKAIMRYQHYCFLLFMIVNTVGFFTSMVLISLLISKFPLKAWLRLSVISMAMSFTCGVCFIASFTSCTKYVLSLFFFGVIVGSYYWWIKRIRILPVRWR